jgi:hypothetical protein
LVSKFEVLSEIPPVRPIQKETQKPDRTDQNSRTGSKQAKYSVRCRPLTGTDQNIRTGSEQMRNMLSVSAWGAEAKEADIIFLSLSLSLSARLVLPPLHHHRYGT